MADSNDDQDAALLLANLKPKPPAEIIARMRELLRRHRRRYLRRFLRPCPMNCRKAETEGRWVEGCRACGSVNPDRCRDSRKFEPLYSKDALCRRFAVELHDPQVLVREYRDIAILLWCLGADGDDDTLGSVEPAIKEDANV